jgi:hypothetical protein
MIPDRWTDSSQRCRGQRPERRTRASAEWMSEAAEYRRFAQMCAENAEAAPSEGDRTALLGLARHWLQRASDAEGRRLATPDTPAPSRPGDQLTPRPSHSSKGWPGAATPRSGSRRRQAGHSYDGASCIKMLRQRPHFRRVPGDIVRLARARGWEGAQAAILAQTTDCFSCRTPNRIVRRRVQSLPNGPYPQILSL